MDLINCTIDHLENKITDLPKMDFGALGNGSCSAIRTVPSNVNSRSLDGGYTTNVAFQVLVQDKSKLKCMNWTNKIFKELEGLNNNTLKSQDGSFELISMHCTTVPNYVTTNDQGDSIWTALFSAEIIF